MKEEINFSQFCDRFRDMNRDNNFTYDGKKALFDYLESYEEDSDTQIELDVIALCCEYNEYSDLKDYLVNYNTDEESETYDNIEDFQKAVIQEIENKTTLIPLGDNPAEDGFIICAY